MLENISVGLNSHRQAFFFSSQILGIRFLNCWSLFLELVRWGRFSKMFGMFVLLAKRVFLLMDLA